jgi:hypothetical protein
MTNAREEGESSGNTALPSKALATGATGQSCRASRAEAESRRKAAELHGKKDDKPDSNTPRRRTRSPLSP